MVATGIRLTVRWNRSSIQGRDASMTPPDTTPPTPAAPVIIVDGVFFQIINTGIARVWRSVLQQWTKTGVAKHVVVVDRAGTAPRIAGLQYVQAPLFHPQTLEADADML